MTETGLKELFYIRLLPADELADHFCCLPYTTIESIIETALLDEDMMFDLLTEVFSILKNNIHLAISKKALRKLLKVCQVLGCTGYFDFGDWEIIRAGGGTAANVEPPKIIKEFIDAGQLEPVAINGKYKLMKTSMKQFIHWCFEQRYGEYISANFILQNILYRGDSPRTIAKYITTEKADEM